MYTYLKLTLFFKKLKDMSVINKHEFFILFLKSKVFFYGLLNSFEFVFLLIFIVFLIILIRKERLVCFEPLTLLICEFNTSLLEPDNKISSLFHVLFLWDFFKLNKLVNFFDLISNSFNLRLKNFRLNFIFIKLLFNSFENESFGLLQFRLKKWVVWIFDHVIQGLLENLQLF